MAGGSRSCSRSREAHTSLLVCAAWLAGHNLPDHQQRTWSAPKVDTHGLMPPVPTAIRYLQQGGQVTTTEVVLSIRFRPAVHPGSMGIPPTTPPRTNSSCNPHPTPRCLQPPPPLHSAADRSPWKLTWLPRRNPSVIQWPPAPPRGAASCRRRRRRAWRGRPCRGWRRTE